MKKKKEITGEVSEIQGTGMMGRYYTGDVLYPNKEGKLETLTDLLYEEFADKKVKIIIEEVK